ncbi:MAG: 3-dehydroquinate synthase [Candidatus Taylorbacteria bacterium]|nr:3-dehydroquinate synthase [Candidatus Taylorbacteria bacterium]
MKTINVQLKKVVDTSYGITVGEGLLSRLPQLLKKEHSASVYVIIADTMTAKLFGKKLQAGLRKAGCKTLLLSVPSGEASKSREHMAVLEDAMLKAGVDRRSSVLALGGGVVGDFAGFVAATYMRGIPYIQLPTTLLAMVDSSIGGKTGINTPLGKNLIGAFHQPKAVYADIDTLRSLSRKELCNGLVEAAKMFMTSDAASFVFLEKNLEKALAQDSKILVELIARAANVKARVVGNDEREDGERMVLNFGHTIGHAVERLSKYALPHGQAVGVGIMVEAQMAHNSGRLSATGLISVQTILQRLQSPISVLRRYKPSDIISATKGDKKSLAGQARYVILKGIGEVENRDGQFVETVGDTDVLQALKDVINYE